MSKANIKIQSDPEVFTDYMSEFNEQLKKGTFREERLLTIKTIANFTGKYEYVVFALKVHIKFGELKTAHEILKTNLNNKNYTKKQKDRLKEIELKIESIEREKEKIQTNNER